MTYELVDQAVTAQVPEADDLDYKAAQRTDEPAKAELAKDLAAMANAGGGLLLVGVAEAGTGAALTISHADVELTPQLEQQVHAINAVRVQPIIESIEVQRLENPSNLGHGVLAIYVPASPDAPHFVLRQDGALAAPRRNGPHTVWLREREIERAYADRFARRLNEEARLQQVRLDVDARLHGTDPWFLGVAIPRNPRPTLLPSPTAEQVIETVTRSVSLDHTSVWQDTPTGSAKGENLQRLYGPAAKQMEDYFINPRRGLRRWIIRKSNGAVDDAYAELHHDGAVVFAFPLPSDPKLRATEGSTSFVRVSFIERGATALVALAAAWAESLAISGPIAVQATALPRKDIPTSAMKAIAPETAGPWTLSETVVPTTIALESLEVVTSDLLDPLDREDRRATAVQIAEDVLHQFGVRNLEILREHNG
nr:ATP-binding protein [Cellulomonas sp. JH27-2]